jgi:transcriptional regulator with PAS, ATPase and Fis domain
MVAQGTFRQDLYYRINVMKIETPALQEHPEDVPQIASHFLRHYGQIFQKPMEAIEPDAMEALKSYAWPGNVRELENVIQRAIILAPGKRLRLQDLPSNLHEEAASTIDDDCVPQGTFERQLWDYKIRLAAAAVRENNGNKAMAARSLNISRSYLHRLIRLAEHGAMFEHDPSEQETVARQVNRFRLVVAQ